MSWMFKIASDLIKEAMSSPETTESTREAPQPPPSTDVLGLLARHRAEIDKNFETVIQMVNAQNERHLRAMRIQQRWNYGLTAGLVIVTILVIVSLWRG